MQVVAPPPMTYMSATGVRTLVECGGEPKCIAIGRSMTDLICWLPAISSWGIGDSKTATLPQPRQSRSLDMTAMALGAFCQVALASRSSLNDGGTASAMASTCSTMSNHGRGFSFIVV